MPADQVVVLPDDVDEETAAALMLKGMTAAYLLHRTHRVRAGETVLVHAAAGGVGLFLCQWAKALGAKVIGTVSSDDKARLARANGCELPLVGRDYRFAPAVKAATNGRGADVIYDGLGRAAMEENLEALALCGHWVSYGQASGSAAAHRSGGPGRQIGDAEPPRAVPPHGGASGVERDRAADLRGAPGRGDPGGAAASLSARRGGGGASRS